MAESWDRLTFNFMEYLNLILFFFKIFFLSHLYTQREAPAQDP